MNLAHRVKFKQDVQCVYATCPDSLKRYDIAFAYAFACFADVQHSSWLLCRLSTNLLQRICQLSILINAIADFTSYKLCKPNVCGGFLKEIPSFNALPVESKF